MFTAKNGPRAERFLNKCEKEVFKRIKNKIRKLESNPFPYDLKRIEGEKFKAFRVRVGDYRIKYIVRHDKKQIIIYDINKRPRVY